MTRVEDRRNLGFAQKVRTLFDPLAAKHDFRCVSENVTLVRYESKLLYLNVYHGRSSYELGIEIDRVGGESESEHGFTLSELLQAQDPAKGAQFRYYTARTREAVDRGVELLFELFKECAGEALGGSGAYFTRLREQRERWKQDYAQNVLASQVRPQAKEAFRRGDFGESVRLYESIRESLTSTERKKLEFARRKLTGL
ncbi:MAG: hypothetical protein HYX75_02940 [Acidobacteria bacterium]|nr:hypothetical protein [Acidobacteriota bacterium]